MPPGSLAEEPLFFSLRGVYPPSPRLFFPASSRNQETDDPHRFLDVLFLSGFIRRNEHPLPLL